MKSRRILLWGWFGFENLGDDLLLNTMLENLSPYSGTITVPMRSQYDIKHQNVKQIERNYTALFREIPHNDMLIIGPGGLFPFDNPRKVAIYFFTALLWKVFGRKVAFFGVGISERMGSFSKAIWRATAAISDLFITRSPAVVEKIGCIESPKIHTMADTVFASSMRFKNSCCEDRVGIFVANLEQQGMEDEYKSSVTTWQGVVSELLDRGFAVDLLAFTRGSDDRLISDIAAAFSNRGGVQTIPYENALSAVEGLNRYKITISMRFHALVLSLLANVPTVPIAYGEKTYLLAEKSGLSKYAIVWNSFQKEYYGYTQDAPLSELMKRIDLLITNRDDAQNNMRQSREAFKTSATYAMKQLIELANQE